MHSQVLCTLWLQPHRRRHQPTKNGRGAAGWGGQWSWCLQRNSKLFTLSQPLPMAILCCNVKLLQDNIPKVHNFCLLLRNQGCCFDPTHDEWSEIKWQPNGISGTQTQYRSENEGTDESKFRKWKWGTSNWTKCTF